MAQMFRVLYDFTAEEDGELTIVTGDIVQDCKMGSEAPEGWILVEATKDSLIGFVPRNYIEEMPESGPIDVTENAPISMDESYYMDDTPQQGFSAPVTPIYANLQKQQVNHQLAFQKLLEKQQADAALKLNKSQYSPNSSQIRKSTNNVSKSHDNYLSLKDSDFFSHSKQQQAGTLSRSSSRDSLHSLHSMNNSINSAAQTPLQRLQNSTNEHKRSLFSVVQNVKTTMAAVNKFSINQIPLVPVVKPPSFAQMVEKEQFDELISSTGEYYDKLIATHTEGVNLHGKTLDEFGNTIRQNIEHTTEIMSRLTSLEELLNDERRRIKQNIDTERNADVMTRTKLASDLTLNNAKNAAGLNDSTIFKGSSSASFRK